MTRTILLFALSLSAAAATAAAASRTVPLSAPIDVVDPMIDTGGEGHTFPGGTAPFGMVQLSPDTDTGCEIRACYSHAAGYRYEDEHADESVVFVSHNACRIVRLTFFGKPAPDQCCCRLGDPRADVG